MESCFHLVFFMMCLVFWYLNSVARNSSFMRKICYFWASNFLSWRHVIVSSQTLQAHLTLLNKRSQVVRRLCRQLSGCCNIKIINFLAKFQITDYFWHFHYCPPNISYGEGKSSVQYSDYHIKFSRSQ